jgi:hypothetical protein
MLHCNMGTRAVDLELEDLLADLHHSRRQNDLGRLALLAYCEARRWARTTGHSEIARMASSMVIDGPHPTRETFLTHIDSIIAAMERSAGRSNTA